MTWHSITISMGWLAVASGVVGTWRISCAGCARAALKGSRSPRGFSSSTWVVSGSPTDSSPTRSEIVLGSALMLPIQLSIVYRLKPWRRWPCPCEALGYFVACVASRRRLLWGWAGGVFGTGVAMSINRAPQLIELVRHPDASGVSATSWFVGALGGTMWILYYTGAHLWAALTATAFASLASLSIALLATWRHSQARQECVHPRGLRFLAI